MRRIILDTNFVLDIIKWKIDFLGELQRICDFTYEVFIPDVVMAELKRFPKRSIEGQNANVALLVLKKNGAKILETGGTYADDAIVKIAGKKDIVATQDQTLKRRLRARGASVIVIREKGYLQLVERTLA